MKLRDKMAEQKIDFYIPEGYEAVIKRGGGYIELVKCKSEENQEPLIKDEKIDYLEIKHLVKEAMREAEEERVKRLAQYYAELCGEEE